MNGELRYFLLYFCFLFFFSLTFMMIALELINKYYPTDTALRRLLIAHSQQVCDRALRIVAAHPELEANREIVERGAMLHDIGIFLCDAPSIHCHGREHYMLHGSLGAALLRQEGEEVMARICERHTGTGLYRSDFEARALPVPATDLLPETIEEIIICYADKFYSKSHIGEERSRERTLQSIAKYGEERLALFLSWMERFE